MKITSQSFPHPILGVQDDISGIFSTDFTWSCDRAFYYLYPVFRIKNESIEKLLEDGLAVYTIHVECGNTFFRKSYFKREKAPQIKINADDLRERVEISFYITAIGAINEYSNIQAHEDYENQVFSIDKGDLLAYGGSATFQAVKNYESLRAVSSIMVIRKAEYEKGLTKVNFNENKIEIWLSRENYVIYNNAKNNSQLNGLFHTSLVLPVLYKSLSYISNEDNDFKNFKWFDVLKTRLDDEGINLDDDDEKHFEIIQKLFGNPMDRFFETINILNEGLDDEE